MSTRRAFIRGLLASVALPSAARLGLVSLAPVIGQNYAWIETIEETCWGVAASEAQRLQVLKWHPLLEAQMPAQYQMTSMRCDHDVNRIMMTPDIER